MSSARDIAQILGISPSAVSMVLNNKPGISEETRQKVLKVADEIGYRKRAWNGRKSVSLQLLIYINNVTFSYSDNPFFSQIIEGISSRTQAMNYTLQVSHIRDSDLAAGVTSAIAANVAGVLVLATGMTHKQLDALSAIPIPVVVLDNPCSRHKLDCISIDNLLGVSLAVQHLAGLGHREFCYVSLDDTSANFLDRRKGYVESVSALPELQHCADNLILIPNSFELDRPQLIQEKIRTMDPIPTAYVCSNDWTASSTIRALNGLGLRVPEDASVVGFDNIPICELVTPKLTTVEIPKQQLGVLAVDQLLQIIDGERRDVRLKTLVMSDLVVRESTGPVKQK